MGLKFYRGTDKSKKIRKRFTQTRTWFRQFKWLACKYTRSIWLTPQLPSRSRSSRVCCRTRIQGWKRLLNWLPLEPRNEAIPDQHPSRFLPTQPPQGSRIFCIMCCRSIFRSFLLRLLRCIHLPDEQPKVRQDARES